MTEQPLPEEQKKSKQAKKSQKKSADYWRTQLSKPSFTGVAASVVLFLMNLVGMFNLSLFIVMLPAIAGVLIEIKAGPAAAAPEEDDTGKSE